MFLINHDFPHRQLLPVIRAVRSRWPALWLGVNFLAVAGRDAFPVLGRLQAEGCKVDAYWADDARIADRPAGPAQAGEIARIPAATGRPGRSFRVFAVNAPSRGDPALSRHPAAPSRARARLATTSGIATGHQADDAKIADFRAGLGDAPLALASGVTPQNAARHGRDHLCVSAVLPGTSWQDECDRQRLESFEGYRAESAFPDAERG